jgi:hypothetical protein
MRLTATPTLAEIAAHPELVDQLSGPVAGLLALEATGLVQRLTVRAVTAPARLAAEAADELLDTRTAARLLGMSPITMQHRARQEPYRSLLVDNGTRSLRWSRRRIEMFLMRPPATAIPVVVAGDAGSAAAALGPVSPPRRRARPRNESG